MQKAVRSLCFDTPAVLPASLAPSGVKAKKEDVQFLVSLLCCLACLRGGMRAQADVLSQTEELMLTRTQAEAALAAAGGDVTKAIQAVVVPAEQR